MDPVPALADHRDARDRLLACIVKSLHEDTRVVAAWLEGSFAWGTADAWSDLDLHVVVTDDAYDAFIAHRAAFFEQMGTVILIQELRKNTQNAASFSLVVYTDGIEVDWSIWRQGDARRPETSHLLLDRIGVPIESLRPFSPTERIAELQHELAFLWAMALVGIKCVGRGYTTGAAHQIGLMAGAFDGLWRLVHHPQTPNFGTVAFRHRPPDPEIARRIPPLGPVLTPEGTLNAILQLCSETEALHPELAALGIRVPDQMPHEVAALAQLARRIAVPVRQPPG